jgi:hypothetical protein
MGQLIRRQRITVAQSEDYPCVGWLLDELPNTPLPKILQYVLRTPARRTVANT